MASFGAPVIPFAVSAGGIIYRHTVNGVLAKHSICKFALNFSDAKRSFLKVPGQARRKFSFKADASREPDPLTKQLSDTSHEQFEEKGHGLDPFDGLKNRFLNFKKQHFVADRIHYENLSRGQEPKFMVVACADSRVCPSNILGFKPGESFTVRNVANIIPPFLYGPSETSAALEFAVTSLEVPNILVVGHSRCGGIRALMSMKEENEADSRFPSFINSWVSIGKSAKLSTQAAAGGLNFEQQCNHCEKESVNASLLNLLTYPWIEERVLEGKLFLHGGYYDFVNCTFEKWDLVHQEGSKYSAGNHFIWS